MELITLNAQNQAGKLIENYDSLIWAERFNTTGDFELQTGNIDQFMDLLPEQTVVSLRSSNVPMIVETHRIIRKKREAAKLIITGRSYESILDRRASINGVAAALAEWLVVAKVPSDVAHYIIYKICVEGICDPADIFPSDKVVFPSPADYLTGTGPNRQYTVPRGNLLATVLQLLQTEMEADPTTSPASPEVPPYGLRAARPAASGTAIGVQIYKGTDRSGTVRFEGTRDMLDDGEYLFSKVSSANAAYVLGPSLSAKMDTVAGATVPTGLDRRVILVDASTSGVTDEMALKAEGSKALSGAHTTAHFDGAINQDLSPYIYGIDYNLGDIVKLEGDYGLSTKARVTEYIRTVDSGGQKSYPTLTALPD